MFASSKEAGNTAQVALPTGTLGGTTMDPRERLQRGQEATAAGRYQDALRDYIWFHDHALEHRPSLYGVRLSFALWYWLELAKLYPEARRALEKIRDQKTTHLLSSKGDRETFHDVEAINEKLGCERATYELFAKLDLANPELAARCANLAMPAIVKLEDFQMARRYISSPDDMLRGYGDMLNEDIDDIERRPPSKAPRRKAYIHIYVERVQLLLEILRGTNETEEAERIRALALELVKSPSVRKAVRNALAGKAKRRQASARAVLKRKRRAAGRKTVTKRKRRITARKA